MKTIGFTVLSALTALALVGSPALATKIASVTPNLSRRAIVAFIGSLPPGRGAVGLYLTAHEPRQTRPGYLEARLHAC